MVVVRQTALEGNKSLTLTRISMKVNSFASFNLGLTYFTVRTEDSTSSLGLGFVGVKCHLTFLFCHVLKKCLSKIIRFLFLCDMAVVVVVLLPLPHFCHLVS